MTKEVNEEKIEEPKVCEECGSLLAVEEGKTFCPKCDGEIDFFGDEDGEENDDE